MRIIAGSLGGRSFESPRSSRTHPMADRIRGALFNTLGDIEGLTVLDAFSGSGALGLEAASRDAASVVSIENDKAAQRSIGQAIRELGLQSTVKLVSASCSAWSETNPDAKFDLVLADPPFDNLQPAVLTKLVGHVSRPDGLFVLNWPGRESTPAFQGFEIVEQKRYGDAQLIFYR